MGHLRTRPAIVRLIDRRGRGRFDAREVVAPHVVLTVPLTLDANADQTTADQDVSNLN
ncbi:MAG: hypothetical protein ICV72_15275 [Aldersonia sp.]|nr:hypothetical protein [Aldersonia sp.]